MASHKLAVLGSPIAHSKSPALHRAAYRQLGVDWEYTRFDIGEAQLAEFLSAHSDWLGFSLTMPLKRELVRIADERGWHVDDTARRAGGGNTWVGGEHPAVYNTDVYGIAQALREAGADARRCAVIGGGATAASAVLAALELAADTIDIYARTLSKAQTLSELAQASGANSNTAAIGELRLGNYSTVLSTLPAGVLRADTLPLPEQTSVTVFEAGYAPSGFSLAQVCAERGGTAVAGERMLIHQAIRQIELFGAACGTLAEAFDTDTVTILERTMTEAASTP